MTSNIPGGRVGRRGALQARVHQPPGRHRRVPQPRPRADRRRSSTCRSSALVARVRERGIEVELTDDAPATLLGNLGYDPTYGARPLKRVDPEAPGRPARAGDPRGRLPRGRHRPRRRRRRRARAVGGREGRAGRRLVPRPADAPRRLRAPAARAGRPAGPDADVAPRAPTPDGIQRAHADLHHALDAHARGRPDDQEQPAAHPRGQQGDRAARRDGQGAVGDARALRLRQRRRGARRADDGARVARARLARDGPLRDARRRSRSTTSSRVCSREGPRRRRRRARARDRPRARALAAGARDPLRAGQPRDRARRPRARRRASTTWPGWPRRPRDEGVDLVVVGPRGAAGRRPRRPARRPRHRGLRAHARGRPARGLQGVRQGGHGGRRRAHRDVARGRHRRGRDGGDRALPGRAQVRRPRRRQGRGHRRGRGAGARGARGVPRRASASAPGASWSRRRSRARSSRCWRCATARRAVADGARAGLQADLRRRRGPEHRRHGLLLAGRPASTAPAWRSSCARSTSRSSTSCATAAPRSTAASTRG